MFNYLKNKRGWAMALVVVVVAVVPIFVAALYAYSMTATKVVNAHTGFEKARYIARSGMEAAMAVWRDASVNAKPSGSLERVYLMNGNTFSKSTDLSSMSAEEIENGTKGYVDVVINDVSGSYANVSVQTQIISTAYADGVSYKLEAISIPYAEGHSIGWYNKNNGKFNQSNAQRTVQYSGYDVHCFVFDGVVTCNADNDFDFEDGATAVLTETIFFNEELDIDSGGPKALIVSAKKAIFNDVIHLEDASNDKTLVLYVPAGNYMEVSGHAGKYGIAYFKEDVIVRKWVIDWWIFGHWKNTTIINAGSNFYYKSINNGIDLIKWSNGEYNSDANAFFSVPSSSIDDSYTPTEASSIYFLFQ